MKQSEALDMITKIQLAHQAMESACKRIDELKEENKNLKEALAKQEQHTLSSRVNDVRVHIEHGKQHDEAMKRISAKQEHDEPVAWRPIETAPKDGSMLLVCLPRQMNIVVRAWYNRLHNFWQTDYEGEGGITRPTYFHEGDLWHPIPPLYTTPQQRTWVGLTDEEIDEGLLRSDYALQTAHAWRAGVVFAMTKLKEKNT